MTSISVYSQKYKTVDDTTRLNKEYVKVKNDIAELNALLIITQNNLPGFRLKANVAVIDAQDAATTSSNQALEATNGNFKDAKKAKRKANKAFNDAKYARLANKNVSKQENKITKLTLKINKKQQRLHQLELMHLTIKEKYKLQTPNYLQQ